MNTNLIFRRVGKYSMQEASFNDNCYVCGNAKYGDVLVEMKSLEEEKVYICVGCLLLHYHSTKGLWATDNFEKVKLGVIVGNICIDELFFQI